MRALWDKLDAWFQQRQPREKWLLLGAVLVVLFLLWQSLVADVLAQHTKRLKGQITSINNQTNQLTIEAQGVIDSARHNPNAAIKQAEESLTQELSNLEDELEQSTRYFVEPANMLTLLRQLIEQNSGLELKSLRNLQPQPLIDVSASMKQQQAVYRHGIELVFDGDYSSTVNYLRALQSLPAKLIWDSFDYQVSEYPQARIRLRLYSLSTSAGWLGG